MQKRKLRGGPEPAARWAHILQIAAFSWFIIVAGCSTDSEKRPINDEFSNMSTEQRIAMCKRLYKEARVVCQDGLQDQQASRSMECLSVQLKLDRNCVVAK